MRKNRTEAAITDGSPATLPLDASKDCATSAPPFANTRVPGSTYCALDSIGITVRGALPLSAIMSREVASR